MRVDFLASPELAQRYAVVYADGHDEIENVAWADDAAGEYGVYVTRARALADRKDADLRLRDERGKPKVVVHKCAIEIVDLRESPWKSEAMLLLEDPDVQEMLVGMFMEAIERGLARSGDRS